MSSSIPFFKYFKVFIVVAFYHLITFILRYFICSVCFSGSFEWDCFSDFFPSLLTIDICILEGYMLCMFILFLFLNEHKCTDNYVYICFTCMSVIFVCMSVHCVLA